MQRIIDKMPTGKLKWNSKKHSKQKEQCGRGNAEETNKQTNKMTNPAQPYQ